MKFLKFKRRRREKHKPPTKPLKIILLLIAVILGIILSRVFIVPMKLHNDSMEPNFLQNKRLIVLRHVSPSLGDVIAFRSPIQRNKFSSEE